MNLDRNNVSKQFCIIIGAMLVIACFIGIGSVVAYDTHGVITIEGNDEFGTFASGVRSGSGTALDPYIISGWEIDGGDTETYCIKIMSTTAYAEIQGCKLHDSTYGIMLLSVENIKITASNDISYLDDYGVVITDSSNIEISDNEIDHNNDNDDGVGMGIHVYGSEEITIMRNHIHDQIYGIYFEGVSDSYIDDENEIDHNEDVYGGIGILLMNSDTCTISDHNFIHDNDWGIVLYISDGNTINDANDIDDNADYGKHMLRPVQHYSLGIRVFSPGRDWYHHTYFRPGFYAYFWCLPRPFAHYRL